MKGRSHYDSIVEFWDRLGDEEKAIAAYLELHTNEQGADLKKVIELEKVLRSYSLKELYATNARQLLTYTFDEVVEDYMELHPDANEADVRAELLTFYPKDEL